MAGRPVAARAFFCCPPPKPYRFDEGAPFMARDGCQCQRRLPAQSLRKAQRLPRSNSPTAFFDVDTAAALQVVAKAKQRQAVRLLLNPPVSVAQPDVLSRQGRSTAHEERRLHYQYGLDQCGYAQPNTPRLRDHKVWPSCWRIRVCARTRSRLGRSGPHLSRPEDAVAKFGESVPMKRPGQPAELATAYVMLGDPLSSYVSGAIIAVTRGKPIL
jgi:hypothetical protein